MMSGRLVAATTTTCGQPGVRPVLDLDCAAHLHQRLHAIDLVQQLTQHAVRLQGMAAIDEVATLASRKRIQTTDEELSPLPAPLATDMASTCARAR